MVPAYIMWPKIVTIIMLISNIILNYIVFLPKNYYKFLLFGSHGTQAKISIYFLSSFTYLTTRLASVALWCQKPLIEVTRQELEQ